MIIRSAAESSGLEIAWNLQCGVVHTFVGGSDLHGASVGSDDLDIFGIFVEEPDYTLGVQAGNNLSWETFQWSTAPNTRKNTREDVDIVLHSLRKWARLAAVGNPTILHFLFTPVSPTYTPWHEMVRHKDLFLSRSHVNAFLGYAEAQYKRLNGLLSRDTNRPELVEKYGFDTKMAMHMIRLMFECKELMEKGEITLPSPWKDELIDIRQGRMTLQALNQYYRDLESDCRELSKVSYLPEKVDYQKINRVLVRAYNAHWQFCHYY